MTFTSLAFNTWWGLVPTLFHVWLFAIAAFIFIELLAIGKDYVLDKPHMPWTHIFRTTSFGESLPRPFWDGAWGFWLFQCFLSITVGFGILIFVWPIVLAIIAFTGTMKGLRWAFRTKKAIEDIKTRCSHNHHTSE